MCVDNLPAPRVFVSLFSLPSRLLLPRKHHLASGLFAAGVDTAEVYTRRNIRAIPVLPVPLERMLRGIEHPAGGAADEPAGNVVYADIRTEPVKGLGDAVSVGPTGNTAGSTPDPLSSPSLMTNASL